MLKYLLFFSIALSCNVYSMRAIRSQKSRPSVQLHARHARRFFWGDRPKIDPAGTAEWQDLTKAANQKINAWDKMAQKHKARALLNSLYANAAKTLIDLEKKKLKIQQESVRKYCEHEKIDRDAEYKQLHEIDYLTTSIQKLFPKDKNQQ